MHITYLKLRNFRSYKQIELSFSPGINLFWGNNGQGKTNLLEALHLLSTGRSFRTPRLQDVIREKETFFYIEAHFIKEETHHTLKIYYDAASRKVTYNDTQHTHFTHLLGILPSVLLSPEDLSLVSGSPAERRRFLDLHIAQIDPLYLFYLARYYKAMKQRNALLRSHREETLDAWERIMAPAGSYLISKRMQTVALLQDNASKWMYRFSREREALNLSYSAQHCLRKAEDLPHLLAAQWQRLRRKEMQQGMTLAGPHRDDLSIFLCDRAAKHFSSEGQKRSCATSLRFAQWEHMNHWLGTPPLLSIDDFGIQLDQERQKELCQHIAHFGQVFLTAPHPLTALAEEHPFRSFHIVEGTAQQIEV
jgi:DNA replication and repair protein RecF